MSIRSELILKWLSTFAFVFAAGAAGFMLPSLGAHLSLPLLPSGIAVAACIRWGRRMWPAVFLGDMCIDLSNHHPFLVSVFIGIGSAAAATATARLLQWRGFDPNFSRARDVPLFGFAAALGMMFSAIIGTVGLHPQGESLALSAVSFIRWWSNTTAGVLLVGPMLVSVSQRSVAQFVRHWPEGAVWLFGIVLCCIGIMQFDPAGAGKPLVEVCASMLIVVGSMRFGLVVAAFGALVISAVAACGFAFDLGAFADLGEFEGLASIWSFSAGVTCLNLIVTALLAERDGEGLERLKAERRYQQIFHGSPHPLWVHDPQTLRFLLVNEATVRQYGWTREEFLSAPLSVLECPNHARVLPFGPGETTGDSEPFETRHRTRQGAALEVEVWTRDIELDGRRAVLVFSADVTERRALGSALIDAIGNEQSRISQEMHDGLGQELTGLALSARALATRAERQQRLMAEDLNELASLATACIQSARHIAQGLSPLSNADGSLLAALDALAERSSIAGTVVHFRPRMEIPYVRGLEVRDHLYRIAQEAVQNALKHAQARTIEINLWAHSSGVSLTINDDGVGLQGSPGRGAGLGMRTMRFRASAIGGQLTIATRPAGGVTVCCEVSQRLAAADVAEIWFH